MLRAGVLVLAGLAIMPAPAQAEPTLETVVSGAGLKGFITVDRLPMPDQPWLQEGRAVWADTCEGCHGGNKATGAPKITSTRKWAPRIAQGIPTLIEHATQGFLGKTFAEMPARGANPDLSDAQVAQAVTFMVWASGGAEEALSYIKTLKE